MIFQQNNNMNTISTKPNDTTTAATLPITPSPSSSRSSSTTSSNSPLALSFNRSLPRRRIESVCCDRTTLQFDRNIISPKLRTSLSLPLIKLGEPAHLTRNIFPDVSPRSLRIAEVKSWKCPWMDMDFSSPDGTSSTKHEKPKHFVPTATPPSTPLDLSCEFNALAQNIVNETPEPPAARPTLQLNLEQMPSRMEAEDRAQRAADHLQKAHAQGIPMSELRLRLNSLGSGSESESGSPSRTSNTSTWSPNHGRFITKRVSVSEHGISSPDTAYLHLQHDLVRIREVGRGASGVVYKAVHVPTLNLVAVKDVPVYGRAQCRQMVRELHALYTNLVPISGQSDDNGKPQVPASTKPKPSPHVVNFYDAFVDKKKNSVSLVMQYMGMGSLQDIVLKGGCPSEPLLGQMAICILKGLVHIHGNRMVHRDIKPHNLLLNRQGQVKISDFGLARTLSEHVVMTKTFVGTLLYMAPERISGDDYSYPADIWSFGLSLITVAEGEYPLPVDEGFFGLADSLYTNVDSLRLPSEKYSAECCDFVAKCMSFKPENRPTALDLLEHPFIQKYLEWDYMPLWKAFAREKGLYEIPEKEIDEIADSVYKHIYQNVVGFTATQTHSEFGNIARRHPLTKEVVIVPVEKSLQLGLARNLDLPVDLVYECFELKRQAYSKQLFLLQTYSPQSWTASPGKARREQLLGYEEQASTDEAGQSRHHHHHRHAKSRKSDSSKRRPSFFRRLHQNMREFGSKLGKRNVKTVGNELE